jgi:WD40 repeat protein
VSDDDDNGLTGHLANIARKHQAPPPQPQAGKVGVARVGRFHGNLPGSFWLSAAWSPDGSQLAYGGKTQLGSGVLQAWDGESGHHEEFAMRHLTHGVTGPVISLAWAPDSKHLASLESHHKSGHLTVHIRSRAERSRAIDLPAGLPATQVTWSPDGTLLALSGPDCPGTILLDPASGSQRRVLDGVSGPVAWEPEGRLIAGAEGTSVALFDPVTGQRSRTLTAQQHKPTAIAWARHGRYLAVADGEDILVWDGGAGSQRWRLPWTTAQGDRGPDSTVTAIEWLDGGGYLLEFRRQGGAWRDEQGSTVSTVILWDIETGKWQFVELFHETSRAGDPRPIAGMALAPDGRRIALAFDTATPVIWRITGDLPSYKP